MSSSIGEETKMVNPNEAADGNEAYAIASDPNVDLPRGADEERNFHYSFESLTLTFIM